MSAFVSEFIRVVVFGILIFATAVTFHIGGYRQGVKDEYNRLMQNAVDNGCAKWEVDQKTGKSSVVWCAGIWADDKKKEVKP